MKKIKKTVDDNLVYFRLQCLSKHIGKSLNQIERELGYPRNTLHNYKDKREPSAIRLLEMAEYFGVSPQYLYGLTDIENSTMNLVSQLSTRDKLILNNISDSLQKLLL